MQNVQQLIEDNMNLVYFVIRKDFPRYINDEDLVQVGMLGLCKAANAWDEAKGSFSSLAVPCIYNAICREFRDRNRHKGTYSLDYSYSDSEDDPFTMGDLLVGDSDVDWFDEQDLYDILTEREREVVDLRLDGLTQQEIANQIGMSQQMVATHLRRAKKRWEKTNDY